MIRSNKQGSKGTQVTLVTNNFQLKFKDPTRVISQYDLAIIDPAKLRADPDAANSVPSKFVCQEVFKQLELEEGWAYDGRKNLYHSSTNRINVDTQIKVGRTNYDVNIKGPVSKIRAQDILDAIQKAGSVVPIDAVNAINIVLSQGFNRPDYTTIQRSFFKSEQDAPSIPGGLKLYSGISTSITPTEGFGITIRVLKTHQVVYPGGPLIDFIKENLVNAPSGGGDYNDRGRQIPRRLNQQQIKYFNGILKSIKIKTSHLKYDRKYTLSGVHSESANDTMIEDLGLSVKDYFKGTYNIDLIYPDLPLVKAGGKNKIPMELCTILPDQPYYTSLKPAQQREMIKKACQKPDEKMRDINNAAKQVGQVTSNFTKAGYGFEIDPKAKEVTGRILNLPNMGSKVEKGAWRMTSVKEKVDVNKLGKITFATISLTSQNRYTKNLHDSLMAFLEERASALNIGLQRGDLTSAPLQYARIADLESTIRRLNKRYTFIILDGDESYGNVKLAEKESNRTQCLKLETVEKVCGISQGNKARNNNPRNNKPQQNRPDSNTADNILKKMNMKLGGVNFSVKVEGLPPNIFSTKVMIVGADVTHFTRNENKPSIAAVVATCDAHAGQYISRTKAMYPAEGRLSVEFIHDMKSIMTR